MNRAATASLAALLFLSAPRATIGESPFELLDVPGDAGLVGPPRVAGDGVAIRLIALPVSAGVDVVRVTGAPGATRLVDPIHAVRRGDLLVGGRRGPRVACRHDGARTVDVLAAVTKRTKDGGGDLLAWCSSDDGATWGEPVRVNDVPGCAAEGLFDIAALGDGRFVVVWLDCRQKGARLRADFSEDGATWREDVLAYDSPSGSVCECCDPAVAAAPDGGAVVAFRNLVSGDRDIWTMPLARAATKFGDATKSGKGSWKLAACPMAGPAVGTSKNEEVCAWRRETNVFLVTGAGKERDLGEGTEPQVVVGTDGTDVYWISKDALLRLAPGAKSGKVVASHASLPCAVAIDRRTAVVWLDTVTHRARLALLR